jgi:hypothetical protein
MDIHLISYYIGIFVVFFSQIYILLTNTGSKTVTYNAYITILGAALIAYYFMNKEKFIYF